MFYKASIDIQTNCVIPGTLPFRQLKRVLAWYKKEPAVEMTSKILKTIPEQDRLHDASLLLKRAEYLSFCGTIAFWRNI